MSMSQDTENFEQLRRLLALKRHEQPPPGYFNDFSSQVIARIKPGERGEEGAIFERLFWEAPWLQRIWAALEAKPILAGVFGVAVCGLLITGVVYSDRTDVSSIALMPASEMESAPDGACECVGGRPPAPGQAGHRSSLPAPARSLRPKRTSRCWATSASFGQSPPALVFLAGTDPRD